MQVLKTYTRLLAVAAFLLLLTQCPFLANGQSSRFGLGLQLPVQIESYRSITYLNHSHRNTRLSLRYDVRPNWGLEVSYGQRNYGSLKLLSDSVTFRVNSAMTKSVDLNYYRLLKPLKVGIVPFVGGGVGFRHFSGSEAVLPALPDINFSGQDWGGYLQGLAGLRYELKKHPIEFELSWRPALTYQFDGARPFSFSLQPGVLQLGTRVTLGKKS